MVPHATGTHFKLHHRFEAPHHSCNSFLIRALGLIRFFEAAIVCRKGRRLAEAWSQLEIRRMEWRLMADEITLADCCNDPVLWQAGGFCQWVLWWWSPLIVGHPCFGCLFVY
jgi:hypothetical protein